MIGAWLFLRILAAVYFIAFASLYFQIEGLIGTNGIAPFQAFFDSLAHSNSISTIGRYWLAPSVLWFTPEGSLRALTVIGSVAAVMLFIGRFERLCLAVLWCGYLSIVSADYLFMQYQWDHLLLETGLLAIFLPARDGERFNARAFSRTLLQFLLFRLMFGSGLVKLLSGDPEWRHLTALKYHYLTQPLPSLPAYYAAKMPLWFQMGSAAGMFAIELILPFLFFAFRGARHFAATATIALQLAIFCTGNYTFFNILTIALSVLLFDDKFFVERLPTLHRQLSSKMSELPLRPAPLWAAVPLVVLFTLAAIQIVGLAIGNSALPKALSELQQAAAPLRAVNSYGLFAVMTTTRDELLVETSNDLRQWTSVSFRFKPQAEEVAPTQVAPYQPRLDWQLWFAALGTIRENPWMLRFIEQLLKRTPEVIVLLSEPPPTPARYARVLRYRYRFTSLSERAINGRWWKRELIGSYLPPLKLTPDGRISAVPRSELIEPLMRNSTQLKQE